MNTSARCQLLIPFAAALTLAGCGDHERERGRAAGPAVSETRDVGDFDSIAVRGSAQLHITVGEPASVVIEGRKNAVARVETEVDGDTLRIRTSRKEWMFPGGKSRIVLRISVPQLEDLKLEGGNDARLAGFTGGATRIEIEGAANLEAQGKLDELTVKMAGAGHANLRNLVATDATVTVDGVGSVYVNSTGSLDATMNGVGAILYSGTPREVNTSMNGVGTISRDRDRKSDDDDESEPQLEREDSKKLDPSKLQPEYEV